MSQNIVITIISIILSAFFSWFFTRRSNRRHKVIHFVINSFDIGKGLRDEFPNLKLTNNGIELSNNMIILKGGFINTSTKDICEMDKKMLFQIVLPEGCEVKDIKIKSMTNGLVVQSQKIEKDKENRNIIPFCIEGVFKVNEYFEYIALVELPTDMYELNYKQFKFQHRITNTEIGNIYLGPEKKLKVSFFSNGISMAVEDLKASIFSLAATIAIDILLIVVIIRGNIFDALGLILLISSIFAIISYLIAFAKIVLLVKNNNHILKTISKETDA